MGESDLAGNPYGADLGAAHDPTLRRSVYLMIAMGALHALLFLVSFWLLSIGPATRATDAQIAAFYRRVAQRDTMLVGLYLMPFAGVAFIWFLVALRTLIARRDRREPLLLSNEVLSNILLISGILYVAVFFTTAVAIAATAATVELEGGLISPSVVRLFLGFGHTLLYSIGLRMAAMVVVTTSTIGRRVQLLPRWFSSLGYAVGLLLLLIVSFSPALAVIFPVWLLALCAMMLRRARRHS
jgi:hypothetical protein